MTTAAVHNDALRKQLQAGAGALALGLTDKRGAAHFDRACRDLERLLLITRAGSAALASGWDSNAYVLLERHFDDWLNAHLPE